MKKSLIWFSAMALGIILGFLGVSWINTIVDFIATVYIRLFQFLSLPIIALAIITTLATLGAKKNTGRIFLHTISYTLSTTLAAAVVGLIFFIIIKPDNLPAETVMQAQVNVTQELSTSSYYEHFIKTIPNNLLTPFIEGNVLSILIIAAAIGLTLAFITKSENIKILIKGINGLQELFFALIKGLVWTLPIGIVAFSAQLSAQMSSGAIAGSLGKYTAVILGGNLFQMFIVLPLFLLLRKLNPLKVFKAMVPAVLMALFTKSSAATLPVTLKSAEERLGVNRNISRFVLPLCTTINMNGCASFILVTSLFIMQNGGTELTWPMMLMWVMIAVISAIGNAGVPMGCYFLTLSLMSGIGAPVGIMGIILPIYTIIDMVETAENVWSDSCVCAMTNAAVDTGHEKD